MCDHCAALVDNQIRNLLITVPPRHTKSSLPQCRDAVVGWVKFPELRFLYASFSADLSSNMRCSVVASFSRRSIRGSGARRVQLMGDQNIKSFYENSERGYRISSSVGRHGHRAWRATSWASTTRTTCRRLTREHCAARSAAVLPACVVGPLQRPEDRPTAGHHAARARGRTLRHHIMETCGRGMVPPESADRVRADAICRGEGQRRHPQRECGERGGAPHVRDSTKRTCRPTFWCATRSG